MGASQTMETPWGLADEKDLEIAVLLGHGLSMSDVARIVGFSSHARVSQRAQEREAFYTRVTQIVEISRREARLESDEDWRQTMLNRWNGLWDKAHDVVAQAIDAGDLATAREVLRDIRERAFGKPAQKIEWEGHLTGAVAHAHQHTHLVPVEMVQQLRASYTEQRRLLGAGRVPVEPDDGSSPESN